MTISPPERTKALWRRPPPLLLWIHLFRNDGAFYTISEGAGSVAFK